MFDFALSGICISFTESRVARACCCEILRLKANYAPLAHIISAGRLQRDACNNSYSLLLSVPLVGTSKNKSLAGTKLFLSSFSVPSNTPRARAAWGEVWQMKSYKLQEVATLRHNTVAAHNKIIKLLLLSSETESRKERRGKQIWFNILSYVLNVNNWKEILELPLTRYLSSFPRKWEKGKIMFRAMLYEAEKSNGREGWINCFFDRTWNVCCRSFRLRQTMEFISDAKFTH